MWGWGRKEPSSNRRSPSLGNSCLGGAHGPQLPALKSLGTVHKVASGILLYTRKISVLPEEPLVVTGEVLRARELGPLDNHEPDVSISGGTSNCLPSRLYQPWPVTQEAA